MKCPYCGTENTPGTKICIACNAKLYEENEQQPSQSSNAGWYEQPQSQPTQNQPQANTYGQGWYQPTQTQPAQSQPTQNAPGWGQSRMTGAAGWNSAATPNMNATGAPNMYAAGTPNMYAAGAPNMFAAGAPNMFAAGVPMKKAEKTSSSGAKITLAIGGIASLISALLYFAFFTSAIPISAIFQNMRMLPRMLGNILPLFSRILMGIFALLCIKKWTPKKMILPVCLSILAILITLIFVSGAIGSMPGNYLFTTYVFPLCAQILLLISLVLQQQGQKITAMISCLCWGYATLSIISAFSNMLRGGLLQEKSMSFNLTGNIFWNAALFLICIGLVCGPQKDAQRV